MPMLHSLHIVLGFVYTHMFVDLNFEPAVFPNDIAKPPVLYYRTHC